MGLIQYSDNNGNSHGFLDSNSTFSTIDDPKGQTLAVAINDSGQIVGFYDDTAGLTNGFLDTGGAFTTIDDPNGTNGTTADGINEAGQIVGSYEDVTGSHGYVTGAAASTVPEPSSLSMTAIAMIVGMFVSATRKVLKAC
jgi:uncharacterized membrane protein